MRGVWAARQSSASVSGAKSASAARKARTAGSVMMMIVSLPIEDGRTSLRKPVMLVPMLGLRVMLVQEAEEEEKMELGSLERQRSSLLVL